MIIRYDIEYGRYYVDEYDKPKVEALVGRLEYESEYDYYILSGQQHKQLLEAGW